MELTKDWTVWLRNSLIARKNRAFISRAKTQKREMVPDEVKNHLIHIDDKIIEMCNDKIRDFCS